MHGLLLGGEAVMVLAAVMLSVAIVKQAHVADFEELAARGELFICEPCESTMQCACLEGMPAAFRVGTDVVPVCLQCARVAFTQWQLQAIHVRAEMKAQILVADAKG